MKDRTLCCNEVPWPPNWLKGNMGPGHLVSTWGWGGQKETRWKTENDFKYKEKSFWLRIRYLCLFQNFPQQMGKVPPIPHRKLETVEPILSISLGSKLCRNYWTYHSQCPDKSQNQFADKIRNGHSTHLWVQRRTSLKLQGFPPEDVCPVPLKTL